MTSKTVRQPDLFSVSDALVSDMMTLSDDVLLEEVREDGQDPQTIAREMRALITAASLEHGRLRLLAARQALDRTRQARSGETVVQLPLNRKQQILSQFAANDGQLRSRLTMAARQGVGASEREMDDILRDLRELGAIDDDGNIR